MQALNLCFNELGPTIINIINFSYLEESFHPHSKSSTQIKHFFLMTISTTFDLLIIWNYSIKFLEKSLCFSYPVYLLSNSLFSSFQSAYRMFHSIEVTLLNLHTDLILAMKVTSVVLLGLLAAFDMCQSSILLHCLQNWFGLSIAILPIGFHLTFPLAPRYSLQPKFHNIIFLSFVWYTSRIRTWITSVHSLYNLTRLCHL